MSSPRADGKAKPRKKTTFTDVLYLCFIAVSNFFSKYKDSKTFAVTIDIAVFVNAIVVGLELDYAGNAPSSIQTLKYIICGLYIWEVFWKVGVDGIIRRKLVWKKPWEDRAIGIFFFSPYRQGGLANLCELALIIPALAHTFASLDPWLWRISVLRVVRYCRIHKLAARWRPLTELWLVLMGLARASKALAWFFLLLICCVYGFSGAASGLVDSDGIQHTPGFDSEEYFGSTTRSMLTLLQLATLDGWASTVVRPLMTSRPLAAVVLLIFAFVTAYGFLSVGVGVLVWSTVELAHKHEGHGTQMSMAEDMGRIKALTTYFHSDLIAANREMVLTKRDFHDAMVVPQLASEFRKLDLPLPDIESLFRHIDHQRKGNITVEQFEKSLTNLKKPATRFDVACLTATLGGSSTSVSRLERRADDVLSKLETVKRTLGSSFEELNKLAQPDSETGQVPEVQLRRAGRIVNTAQPPPPRYTF